MNNRVYTCFLPRWDHLSDGQSCQSLNTELWLHVKWHFRWNGGEKSSL